ncbi:MAG: hypothetical protein AAGI23_14715 [Bacteroidota bacterium]
MKTTYTYLPAIGRILSILILLLASSITTVHAQQNPPPAKLAVYYGYPSLTNNIAAYANGAPRGDIAVAAASLAQYDLLVIGDGLQDPCHPDHNNTKSIIGILNNQNVAVYGYIDLGVSIQNLTPITIQYRIEKWKEMGVTGIFLDDAGEDFGVSEERMSNAIIWVHNADLSAFVNGFDPDFVFNTGEMKGQDWYMIESFHVRNGELYTTPKDQQYMEQKYQKCADYSKQYQTKIAALTTSTDERGYNQELMNSAWQLAEKWNFHAFGWGEPNFSASGSSANILPFRPRPE